jgi:hypothetical protein
MKKSWEILNNLILQLLNLNIKTITTYIKSFFSFHVIFYILEAVGIMQSTVVASTHAVRSSLFLQHAFAV